MKNTNRQYAIALYETTRDLSGSDVSTAVENFVRLLARDRKLKQANSIIREFEAYAQKKEGIVSIEITSARKLDKATAAAVIKAFGEQVEAIEKIDVHLIGGVRVKMEDKILDASVRSNLLRLRQLLQ